MTTSRYSTIVVIAAFRSFSVYYAILLVTFIDHTVTDHSVK